MVNKPEVGAIIIGPDDTPITDWLILSATKLFDLHALKSSWLRQVYSKRAYVSITSRYKCSSQSSAPFWKGVTFSNHSFALHDSLPPTLRNEAINIIERLEGCIVPEFPPPSKSGAIIVAPYLSIPGENLAQQTVTIACLVSLPFLISNNYVYNH